MYDSSLEAVERRRAARRSTSTPSDDRMGSTSDSDIGVAGAEDLEPRLAGAGVRRLVEGQVERPVGRRCPRAGRGRPRRSAAGSPPCRPRGRRRRTSGPAGRRAPRRTPRAPRPRSRRPRTGRPRRAGARGRPGRSRRSVPPGSGRTTKCSRARIDSLTRAVKSSDAPPSSLLEDVGDALADAGGVAVARQVDQAGEVAAVGVAAHEQPQLATLAECTAPTRRSARARRSASGTARRAGRSPGCPSGPCRCG